MWILLQEFVAASMSAYQMSHGLLAGSSKAWQNRVRVVFDKIDEDGNGYAHASTPTSAQLTHVCYVLICCRRSTNLCRFISKDELAKLMGDDASVREVIAEADKDGAIWRFDTNDLYPTALAWSLGIVPCATSIDSIHPFNIHIRC